MRTVELKEYQEGVIKTSTKELIVQVIDYSVGKGITTSDQRKRIKLLDLIEPQFEGKELTLEDADFKYLSDLVEGMQWAVSNKIVRDFIKDFS